MSKLTKNQKAMLAKVEPNKVYKLSEAAELLKEITFYEIRRVRGHGRTPGRRPPQGKPDGQGVSLPCRMVQVKQ